jgi:hypothetical protein
MAQKEPPFLLAKQLETQLNLTLSAIDIYSLPVKEAKLIKALRQEMTDARLDVRDYELSETRDEQLKNAKSAKKRLEHVRRNILAASEYNVFSAADVAITSAQIEQIMENIN